MSQVANYAQIASEFFQSRKATPAWSGSWCSRLVDVSSGLLRLAANLHWSNVPIRGILSGYFDCPIYVENEAMLLRRRVLFRCRSYVNGLFYLSAGVGLGVELFLVERFLGECLLCW